MGCLIVRLLLDCLVDLARRSPFDARRSEDGVALDDSSDILGVHMLAERVFLEMGYEEVD